MIAGHPAAPQRPVVHRLVEIDALRGFALLGILIVHMVEQYTAAPLPRNEPRFGMFSSLDVFVRGLVTVLFMGKFFSMFSLLFGLSFFMQMKRSAGAGGSAERRFLRRLAVLFAIGVAHQCLYRGDILSTYAVLGVLLIPLSRASGRILAATAVLMCLSTPRVLLVALTAQGVAVPVAPPKGAENDAYYEVLKGPSPGAVVAANLTEGMRNNWEYQLGMFGRAYQSLGLFLVGIYVGRRGWHESIPDHRAALRNVLIYSAGISVGVSVLFGAAVAVQGGMPPLVSWRAVVDLTLYDIFNLAVMVSLAAGFLLLRPRAQRLLEPLAQVGRMALTNYVGQSVIGTFVFYGYGLNRLGEIGAAAAFALAIVVFMAQVVASRLWLSYFWVGPLEWIWRSLTDGRAEPLRNLVRPVET